MTNACFWNLDHCSNGELLAGLEGIVRSCRQRTAELVAHLGEVEVRRLHLEMAYSSLFDYCVRRLGLSEDEACRRIEVARLARRFPALFPRLASGEISLTVAAVLKPHLSEANEADVLVRVAGKTIQQARETLAALFPQSDVVQGIRKLPERRAVPAAKVDARCEIASVGHAAVNAHAALSESRPVAAASQVALSAPARKPLPPIEPLSEARYRVQFTAGTALKEKLERARDLLRHRNPSGDLAIVVERALDVLVDQLMKERFGATPKPRSSNDARTKRVSNATRRAVLDRDGLQCSWVDAHGRRCSSRAWLELDHRHPRGKGGGSERENIRLLCRAHNRLAAEHEYGQQTIVAAIAERRAARNG